VLELVMKSGEHERQDRLRDPRTRRQGSCESLQGLRGAKPLDEAVEHGTVHGDRPNEAFGRAVMVLSGRG
jgi:hypothetical protein